MKDIVDRLRDAAEAYPEDIFPAPSKLQLAMHPEVITRASASMGRHFSPMLTAAADEIDRLRRDAERYRFLRDALLDYGDNRLAALDDLPKPESAADFDAGIDAAMREQDANT